MDVGEENWDEGTDSKWKSYQNIRKMKRKMWMEEKQIKKHQARFGGLTA